MGAERRGSAGTRTVGLGWGDRGSGERGRGVWAQANTVEGGRGSGEGSARRAPAASFVRERERER